MKLLRLLVLGPLLIVWTAILGLILGIMLVLMHIEEFFDDPKGKIWLSGEKQKRKKFQVKSKSGKSLSKPGLSKKKAEKRLAQVEYFKTVNAAAAKPMKMPKNDEDGDENC